MRRQVDLCIDRIVVGDGRKADLGHGAVVLDDAALVRTVGIRRQCHHRVGARLGGLVRPSDGLPGAVGANRGYDGESLRCDLDRRGDDALALFGCQRLVFAEGAVWSDAITTAVSEPATCSA